MPVFSLLLKKSILRLHRATRFVSLAVREGRAVGKAILFAIFLNLFFGGFFYLLEKDLQPELTLGDSIWWAMVTMTTVGYGDYSAKTFLGRFLISYPCMLIGIGIIGYLVGSLADQILRYSSKKRRGLMKIQQEGHLVFCNFPGTLKILKIIKEIKAHPAYKDHCFVLISDKIEQLPEPLVKAGFLFVHGNPTDEEILLQANILKCSGVFVLASEQDMITSDEKVFAIGTVIEIIEKEYGYPIRTIVELKNASNFKLMTKSNVDGIITSDGLTSKLLVQEFLYPGVHDIVQQLMSNEYGSQFYIFPTALEGYKVVDIQVAITRHPTNMQIIGIIKNKREKILNPPKSAIIEKNDELIILSEKPEDFKKIEQEILSNKELYMVAL